MDANAGVSGATGSCLTGAAAFTLLALGTSAQAADYYFPIVMPVTGFMSVEGGSQRNGVIMAFEDAAASVDYPIYDTGTSAAGAATALDNALSSGDAIAAAISIYGTEVIAMMPVAEEYEVPMLTISGLAMVTESGNPWMFRFLPNDREIKVAHARYVKEELNLSRPALVGDTTAYGQGGFALLKENFEKLGVELAFEDASIAPDTKDMTPLLTKLKESGADSIVLHTVAAPMALIIKQARASGMELPIITSSSLVEPTATALFEPEELANVCAETPSAPEARATPEMTEWADAYMERFGLEPDGLALGHYDGVRMALRLIGEGADTPEKLREAFHNSTYEGIAMTYESDGEGDMAHDADIVCWTGKSRVPEVVGHYAGDEMILN